MATLGNFFGINTVKGGGGVEFVSLNLQDFLDYHSSANCASPDSCVRFIHLTFRLLSLTLQCDRIALVLRSKGFHPLK